MSNAYHLFNKIVKFFSKNIMWMLCGCHVITNNWFISNKNFTVQVFYIEMYVDGFVCLTHNLITLVNLIGLAVLEFRWFKSLGCKLYNSFLLQVLICIFFKSLSTKNVINSIKLISILPCKFSKRNFNLKLLFRTLINYHLVKTKDQIPQTEHKLCFMLIHDGI